MKRREIKELAQKTTGELQKLLKEVNEEVFTLRMQQTKFELKNTSSLVGKRKDIARIKTVVREKELQEGKNL